MVELTNGKISSSEFENPSDSHDYFFSIEPNQTVTIAFDAPPFEYLLSYTDLEPKGKGAIAHAVAPELTGPLTVTQTLVFKAVSEGQKIFVTVANANPSLPTAGYTISMTVE